MLEIKACQQAIRQFLRRRGSEPLLSNHNGGTLASRMLQLAEKKQKKKKKRDVRHGTATVVVTVFLCFSTHGIARKRQQGRKACGQYESKEVTVLVLKVLQFSTVTCKLILELLLR